MLLGANGANRKPVLLLRFRQDGSQPHAVFIRPGPGVLRTCGAARSLNHDPYEAPRCRMRSITGGSFAFAIGANNRARNGRLPLNGPGGDHGPGPRNTPADSSHSGRLGIVLELRPQIGWNLNRQIAHPVRRGLLLGSVTGDRTTHHGVRRPGTISKPAMRSAVDGDPPPHHALDQFA